MKAFVIKNKEGKYYQSCYNQSPFTDDLFDANKYQYKEETEKILNGSFTLVDTLEVVEITIAEGELEQENKRLKEQLAEKDKEIEELKRDLQLEWAFTPVRGDGKTFTKLNVIKDFKNSIRKQVCDEIRNYIDNEIYDRFGDQEVDYLTIDLEEFEDLLQDLEQVTEK